jgi:hypothetical protein
MKTLVNAFWRLPRLDCKLHKPMDINNMANREKTIWGIFLPNQFLMVTGFRLME